MASAGALVHHEATNAVAGWTLVGGATITAARSAVTGEYLWAAFAVLVAAVAALPALVSGDPREMVPWPLLAVAVGAVVVHAAGRYQEVVGPGAVAALALVGVAELDAFSAVEMSRRFAVGFAVLTTLAVQGVWTVAQFYADRWLETEYLTTQVELQWDIALVTGISLLLGVLFQWYVDRFEPPGTPAYREDTAG